MLQQVPRLPNRLGVVLGTCVLSLFLLSNSFFLHSPSRAGPAPVTFPRKIWQLWKSDGFSLEERELVRAKSWVQQNPSYRYELLSDGNEQEYVDITYGIHGLNRPDIVQWYRSVKDRIVRADVLRYLVMYAEGGVYTDIDVEALQPITHWIPEHYNLRDINMVIGIEIDQPDFSDHRILGQKSMSFCQWTFISKPRHAVMLKLVEHIMSWMNRIAKEQKVSVSDVKLDFDDIITGTGPSAFTKIMLEYMSVKLGHEVRWDMFHNAIESKLVSGILVLPVEAYAAGQGHSDSGSHNTRRALVRHHYHASGWPLSHPRFNHPMYGQVEDCNWDRKCVDQWDADVGGWERLSAKEKKTKLEDKKAAETREEEKKHREEEEQRRRDEDEKRAKEKEALCAEPPLS